MYDTGTGKLELFKGSEHCKILTDCVVDRLPLEVHRGSRQAGVLVRVVQRVREGSSAFDTELVQCRSQGLTMCAKSVMQRTAHSKTRHASRPVGETRSNGATDSKPSMN